MKKSVFFFGLLLFWFVSITYGQKITIDRNKPERLEWFRDLGFGMFIHWSIDVQLGAIISHNVAVASKDYQDQYFNELPKTFNPKKFDPVEWAKLAKLAGMKYMVFTAKHHNGFCMWDTKTSFFNIMNSGYGTDILKEIIEAFRKQGIAIGLYFSPDDYFVMYQQGYPPSRNSKESESTRNSELWEINKKQLRE
ncbi:MAG: alpha-L-fucosidase, partial [Cyclobacteriaceae bacterium]|nr:alpha-L-fucosidase [Cyclobacteriaceae bacterium]